MTFAIHDAVEGHASPLEQFHFLPVQPGHRMLGVRQTDERDSFVLPVACEYRRRIRSNCQYHRAPPGKFFMLIAQARQLRATVGSHKSAQECEQHRLPAKIRQADPFSGHVLQFEIRSQLTGCDQYGLQAAVVSPSSKSRPTSLQRAFPSAYSGGWGDRSRGSIRRFRVYTGCHDQT